MMMKRDLLVAAKTVDTPKTHLTFEKKDSDGSSYSFLFFKMGWQKGVNSGINEAGLAVLSAYAGTYLPKAGDIPDTRGLANERVLSQCSNAHEGLRNLEAFFQDFPSGVGGTHFLMDASGAMAVLEHEPNANVRHEMVKVDYVIRANDPLLLKSKTDNVIEFEDRRLRYAQAKMELTEISGETWLNQMKKLLSMHLPNEIGQNGALCIHEFENKGSRSKDLTTHTTETALIFDIKNKSLFYSEGPPCQDKWSVLTL